MKLYDQPTNLEILKTFQDSKGNNYKLVGQRNVSQNSSYPLTNYYELYKKDAKAKDFVKYGAKQEVYVDSYNGLSPSIIQKERFNKNTGKLIEACEISKQLNGYDIECKNEALSMNEPLRVLYVKDNFNRSITKVKMPLHMSIMGVRPFSNMTKRIMKLLRYV